MPVSDPLSQKTTDGCVDAPLEGGMLLFQQRYLLQRCLGQGGMGVVWLAWDERLKKHFALKFISGARGWSGTEIERLHDEVRATQEMRHENVVATYDLGHEPPYAAMIMEHLEGRTLTQLLENAPHGCFEPEEVQPWAHSLIVALRYIHKVKGCVHRDIKPANVMLTAGGVIKLMDFGISEQVRHTVNQHAALQEKRPGGSGRTPLYASPQLLEGETASESDDIYGLGALLYEMLTGRPPFFGETGDILDHQIRHTMPDALDVRRAKLRKKAVVRGELQPVPKTWEKAILRCLAKKPAERPTHDELEALFSRPGPKLRKRRPLVLAWAALMLLLFIGLWGAWHGWFAPGQTADAPAPPSLLLPEPTIPKALPVIEPPEVSNDEREAVATARRYYEVSSLPNWQQERAGLWAPQVTYFERFMEDSKEIPGLEARHRELWDMERYTLDEGQRVKALPENRFEVMLTVHIDLENDVYSRTGERETTMILGQTGDGWRIQSIHSKRVGTDKVTIDPLKQRAEIARFLTDLIALDCKVPGTSFNKAAIKDFYDEKVDAFPLVPPNVPDVQNAIAEIYEQASNGSYSRDFTMTGEPALEKKAYGSELLTLRVPIKWEIVRPNGNREQAMADRVVTLIYYGRPKVRAIKLENVRSY